MLGLGVAEGRLEETVRGDDEAEEEAVKGRDWVLNLRVSIRVMHEPSRARNLCSRRTEG